jgi:gluconolactonase
MRAGEPPLRLRDLRHGAVFRVRVLVDGSAGARAFRQDLPGLPDGIAFDERGQPCSSPATSRRRSCACRPTGRGEVYIEDVTAHTLRHPTNIAFAAPSLYAANLGRWHVAVVDMDLGAPPLWTEGA